MEGKFTMAELTNAVKQLKHNKSPGGDGIPVEFYIMLWSKISKIVLDAINYGFDTEQLHNSALYGVICLLPKKGKDSRYICNIEDPITLLNTDYKLIEKVLANRLKPALEKIINEDQKRIYE